MTMTNTVGVAIGVILVTLGTGLGFGLAGSLVLNGNFSWPGTVLGGIVGLFVSLGLALVTHQDGKRIRDKVHALEQAPKQTS